MFGLSRFHLGLLVAVAGANLLVWFVPSSATASSDSVEVAQPLPVEAQSASHAPLSVYQREVRFADVEIRRGVRWQSARVGSGDTLSAVFARRGIRKADIAELANRDSFQAQVGKLRAGTVIDYQVDERGALQVVRYPINALETFVFSRAGDTFRFAHETRTPERRVVVRNGVVSRSLFLAGQRAGLTSQLTLSLAQIFQSDIDFALDIRPGDRFSLVYEELYLDGKRVGEGNILAAEFVNQGKSYRAIRFAKEGARPGYYTPAGRSTRKAFIRAPLEFFRVSSNFNMRRFHPVLRIVRPHRGIDYAAPTGTPVWAAGDGKVATAASDSSSGRYIVINHGTKYQTKYLHLSRFATGLRAGDRVRQGQVIGYVGTTGLSTGPHLHFEFIENGVHKNPSSANMMEEPIAGADKVRFMARTAVLTAAIEGGALNTIALARIADE